MSFGLCLCCAVLSCAMLCWWYVPLSCPGEPGWPAVMLSTVGTLIHPLHLQTGYTEHVAKEAKHPKTSSKVTEKLDRLQQAYIKQV